MKICVVLYHNLFFSYAGYSFYLNVMNDVHDPRLLVHDFFQVVHFSDDAQELNDRSFDDFLAPHQFHFFVKLHYGFYYFSNFFSSSNKFSDKRFSLFFFLEVLVITLRLFFLSRHINWQKICKN